MHAYAIRAMADELGKIAKMIGGRFIPDAISKATQPAAQKIVGAAGAATASLPTPAWKQTSTGILNKLTGAAKAPIGAPAMAGAAPALSPSRIAEQVSAQNPAFARKLQEAKAVGVDQRTAASASVIAPGFNAMGRMPNAVQQRDMVGNVDRLKSMHVNSMAKAQEATKARMAAEAVGNQQRAAGSLRRAPVTVYDPNF